jgi:thiamine-monophosphate kinase
VSPGPSTEDALVRRIRDLAARTSGAGVRVGIGDDCAVLETQPGTKLIATTDLLIEDVHFRRRWAKPADLGWKAMAVNLSDIAAMGGRPRWALVALAAVKAPPPRRSTPSIPARSRWHRPTRRSSSAATPRRPRPAG